MLLKTLLVTQLLLALLFLSSNVHAEWFFKTKDLELVETAEDSDDQINRLVREISAAQGDPRKIGEISGQIFGLIDKGRAITDHDYLWTLYAVVIGAGPEIEGGMSQKDYLHITDTAMNFLHANSVGDWVYTDFGQFKIEVYKQAANGAAWTLKDSNPKTALPYIDAGLEFMSDEDLWMLDTKVRILLNLKLENDAYAIVKEVLTSSPDFVDFQDFKTNENYAEWLKSNSKPD